MHPLGSLDVRTGYPGSIHDARILRMSRLHWKVSQGDWLKAHDGPLCIARINSSRHILSELKSPESSV